MHTIQRTALLSFPVLPFLQFPESSQPTFLSQIFSSPLQIRLSSKGEGEYDFTGATFKELHTA
jgi:hypothetical protein